MKEQCNHKWMAAKYGAMDYEEGFKGRVEPNISDVVCMMCKKVLNLNKCAEENPQVLQKQDI